MFLCLSDRPLSGVPSLPNISEKLRIDYPEYAHYKLDIRIQEEKHNDRQALDKQINDKERVTAALENPALKSFVLGLIRQREGDY